jgi:hypothetical protein
MDINVYRVNILDNECQLHKHILYLIFHDYIFLLIHKLIILFILIIHFHY